MCQIKLNLLQQKEEEGGNIATIKNIQGFGIKKLTT